MSSKTTIFLTKDNEHCYTDCDEPTAQGDVMYLEIDEKNIEYQTNDGADGLVIGIKPGCELYNLLLKLKQ